MGIAEILESENTIRISSHLIIYGNKASAELAELIREEIETLWNEPQGTVIIKGNSYRVIFQTTAQHRPDLTEREVLENVNPLNNYFRIEEFAQGNISFVDGIGCNTGYFKLENLYKGSTTAAHEYGHTLGLDHPENLDLRGKGVPGIMYPRGTLVDPPYQYNPSMPAGAPGGTMHPMYRKVLPEDILSLKLEKRQFTNRKAVVGEFTNVWHEDHANLAQHHKLT
ncbi:MAG: peptidase M10 [Chitinophagaceae bacterium]|nr:peptidase M10 [Chitinophagaceae bacterium]